MNEIKGHTETKYWIAKTGEIIHYGIAEVGSVVTSGMNEFYIYENESDWKEALLNYEITP